MLDLVFGGQGDGVSDSYRKTPAGGFTTAKSDKPWKRVAAKRVRLAVRRAIAREHEVMPLSRELDDEWWGPKDGKGYRPWLADSKWMRK